MAGGINPFLYVLNDPVNRIDPFGLYNEADYILDAIMGNQNHSDYGAYTEGADQAFEDEVRPAITTTLAGSAVVLGGISGAGAASLYGPEVTAATLSALAQNPNLPKDIWDFSSGLLFKPGEPDGVYSPLNSLGTLLGTGIKSIYNYFNSFSKSEDSPCD